MRGIGPSQRVWMRHDDDTQTCGPGMSDILPTLKPIAMKERVSILFLERGELDVLDGAFVVVDKTGVRTHIPVGKRLHA